MLFDARHVTSAPSAAATADSYTPTSQAGLSQAGKQALLDLHNAYRAKIALGEVEKQPPAANMQALSWDDRMVSGVRTWIDTCNKEHYHDPKATRGTKPYYYVGQNLAWNTVKTSFLKISFDDWSRESSSYVYESKFCTPDKNGDAVCNHFLQLTWAKTKYVGCYYKTCGKWNDLGCNYAIGIEGKGHTYIKGKACSKCPNGFSYCMGKALCATREQCQSSSSQCTCLVNREQCSAHGTFDGANCKCTCTPGWTGANCETQCKDRPEKQCSILKAECRWDSRFIVSVMNDCQKTCKCGGLQDTFHKDSDNLRVNSETGTAGGDVNKEDLTKSDEDESSRGEGAVKGTDEGDVSKNTIPDNGQSPTDSKEENDVSEGNAEKPCSNIAPVEQCAAWRDAGRCTDPLHAKFVMNLCCITCRLARVRGDTLGDEPREGTTNNDVSEGNAEKPCSNIAPVEQCAAWRDAGRCTDPRHAKFVMNLCCITCRNLEGPCFNTETDKQCVAWKDAGYCTNLDYVKMMKEKCCHTCRLARVRGDTLGDEPREGTTNKGELESKCVNSESESRCLKLKEQGWCTGLYQEYMETNCCKVCSKKGNQGAKVDETKVEKPCLNTESDQQCTVWKQGGFCTSEKAKTECCETCRGKTGTAPGDEPRRDDDNRGNLEEPCVDRESLRQCLDWRDDGHCTISKFAKDMNRECCKTCRLKK